MNYKIHVSHAAEHDLHSAANYIAHQLQNPLAARRMLANALASIDSLETFPGRFPVIDEPLLASHQLHFVPGRIIFCSIGSTLPPRPSTSSASCMVTATGRLSCGRMFFQHEHSPRPFAGENFCAVIFSLMKFAHLSSIFVSQWPIFACTGAAFVLFYAYL